MLSKRFFARDAAEVAQALLGKIIKVKHGKLWLTVKIIETEAYYLHEKGSHASLGYTAKRRGLFMPPGTIYMYYSRGHDSLNVSCAGAGNAVLIKSGVPFIVTYTPTTMLQTMQRLNPSKNPDFPRNPMRLCSGQTLLCKSLGLRVKDWDQQQFDPDRFYFEDEHYRPKKIIQTTRLGIPLGRDEHLWLRFIDYDYVKYCTSNPLTKRDAVEGKTYRFVYTHHTSKCEV